MACNNNQQTHEYNGRVNKELLEEYKQLKKLRVHVEASRNSTILAAVDSELSRVSGWLIRGLGQEALDKLFDL